MKGSRFSWIMFAIIALAGFLVYFVGFLESGYGFLISFFRSILSATKMFVNSDNYTSISNPISSQAMVQSLWFEPVFWSVHFFAFFWSIYQVVILFGRRLVERFIVQFHFKDEIYVFYGINQKSLALASSLLTRNNRLVVFMDCDANSSMEQAIHDLGAHLIREQVWDEDQLNRGILKMIGFPGRLGQKSLHFFLFSSDEKQNILLAKEISQAAREASLPWDHLKLYLLVQDDMLLKNMESTNSQPFDSQGHYEINFIQEGSLAARRLFMDHPPLEQLNFDPQMATVKEESLTFMIVGFGETGREVLLKGLELGQFVRSKQDQTEPLLFRALIFDHDLEEKLWQFRINVPALEQAYPGIQFTQSAIGSEIFNDCLLKNINDIHYIVVADESGRDNLQTAQYIHKFLENQGMVDRPPFIAVYVKDRLPKLLKNQTISLFSDFYFFGNHDELFTENIIIHESMDQLAKQVNICYNEKHRPDLAAIGVDNWKSLDLFEKNSNRAAAEHIQTKLKLVGYDLSDKIYQWKEKISKQNDDTPDIQLEKPPGDSLFADNDLLDHYLSWEQLSNLLRIEHMRWCAFHYANGWRPYSPEEIALMKEEYGKGKIPYAKRKDKRRKIHGCLVGWEELATISQIMEYQENLNERFMEKYDELVGYQRIDLEQILDIPRILNKVNIPVQRWDKGAD